MKKMKRHTSESLEGFFDFNFDKKVRNRDEVTRLRMVNSHSGVHKITVGLALAYNRIIFPVLFKYYYSMKY